MRVRNTYSWVTHFQPVPWTTNKHHIIYIKHPNNSVFQQPTISCRWAQFTRQSLGLMEYPSQLEQASSRVAAAVLRRHQQTAATAVQRLPAHCTGQQHIYTRAPRVTVSGRPNTCRSQRVKVWRAVQMAGDALTRVHSDWLIMSCLTFGVGRKKRPQKHYVHNIILKKKQTSMVHCRPCDAAEWDTFPCVLSCVPITKHMQYTCADTGSSTL